MTDGIDTAPALERTIHRSTRPVRMTMCAALMVAANIVGAILVARTAGAATTPNISRTSLVSPLNFHYDEVLILRH